MAQINTTSKSQIFGVSQPISMAQPEPQDILNTVSLMKALKEHNSFEPTEETAKRVEVLRILNVIVKSWINTITDTRIPNGINQKAGGKLVAFGSYRLGVHSSGGDIDSVVIAPRHVTRSDFFSSLKDILTKDPKVKKLNAVEKAFVPLMTMEYDGIEVDLLFARLDLAVVPENLDLTDDSLLKNLDQESVRSLNGVRCCEQLLKLVPSSESFCMVLRAIKIWAKNHGVYSNSMGFFGGISWAILVARACQLYPNASPSRLIQKVFFVFSTWDWTSPVMLNFLSNERPEMPSLNNLVWGRSYNDQMHLMPIITPSFPEQNSTHNVTRSTRDVIRKELKAALEVCNGIHDGTATWNDLFEETNFYSQYKHFVSLKMDAKSEESEIGYGGFLESRIRHLVGLLERNSGINLAHVNPKKFRSTAKSSFWFIGLEFTDIIKNLDLTKEIQNFKKNLDNQANDFLDVELDIFYVKRAHLYKFVPSAELMKGRFQGGKKSSDKENAGSKKRPCKEANNAAPLAKRSVYVK